MATQEKLLKSLESLQQLIKAKADSTHSRKKEKIMHCHFITEAITNSAIKIAPNFNQLLSFAFETLLELRDDPNTDIHIVVDESLNKIIRVLNDGNIGKIQLELHKEIKKNGPARSLRAALWRFGNLAHMIRPHKGKPYVNNLIPCIIKITEREEETLHDTLTESLPKILRVLGSFTNDSDVKTLMKAFVKNIGHTSTVIRRNSAQCLLTLCLNCRKPYFFLVYALNQLTDLLIPIEDDCRSSLILGVLGGLKIIIPNLKRKEDYQEMLNSFGSKKDQQEISVSLDRQIQIYELCLHYLSFSDHNIINVSLEVLNVLLQNCQPELKEVLLSKTGITQSRLKSTEFETNKESPYDMSIASSRNSEENLLDPLSDPLTSDIEKWIGEATLSTINVNYVSQAKIHIENANSEIVDTVEQEGSISSRSSTNFDELNKSEAIVDKSATTEVEVTSQYSYVVEDSASIITLTDITQDVEIGSFKDANVPLIYCSRLIVKSFLLTGQPNNLIPDRNVKVSVKNLALTCLSSVLQLYPDVLLMSLDLNSSKNLTEIKQPISDILMFANDSDPQLSGVIRMVIASYLNGVFTQSLGQYNQWLNSRSYNSEVLKIKNLIQILIKGLESDLWICVRHTLTAISFCFKQLLYSGSCRCVLPVLKVLPTLAESYWLVKVKLVEIVTEFEYITIEYVTGDCEFQNKILSNVLFKLLGDNDQRVRNASSNAIVKIIPQLYFQKQTPNQSVVINKAIAYKNKYLRNISNLNVDTNIFRNSFISSSPFPYNKYADAENQGVEFGLSAIILKLHEILLTSSSKHLMYGCIETLCFLSSTYPSTVYKASWTCFKNYNFHREKNIFQRSNSIIGNISTVCESNVSSSKDLLNMAISLFSHVTIYDLSFHANLLKFTGNLFAGKCLEDLQLLSDANLDVAQPQWDMFNDATLRELSETFLTHVIKLLHIFTNVIEETVPQIIVTKPVLPNLPPASSLSPLKRRKSDLDKKLLAAVKLEKDDKSEKKSDSAKNNAMGYFANSPHYMKIYDILRMAYSNYKVTLDSSASENLLNFLKTTLSSLCQILEVATINETGRIAEDILRYLRSTFYLDSASTVCCVYQLLKSLFGTNLTTTMSSVNFPNKNNRDGVKEGFYYNLFQEPYLEISNYVNSLNYTDKIECDGDSTVMGYLHRREVKKSAPKGSDKILANYIRIFEPMVIKSLKQYTITSDVSLQCNVLKLLSQLVQLRVNYCLLDSEQIFIGFVLKQFEFIEEGQIPRPSELIPRIFKFLVHLSYSKHHSKSIILVPKIIQLCDGLMASGQNPYTYCIPALEPIVEDIFLVRNKSNTADFKELETTREVLLTMLLRLIEYKEVVDLLALILNESKYCESTDKWQKWSKQVFDVLLTMMKHNKMRLDEEKMMEAIMKLLFVMNPSVFKNVNDVLVCLFQKLPFNGDLTTLINRHLGKIIVLLLILTQNKEEVLLAKISESSKDFSPSSICENIETTPDPLNVLNHSNYFEGIPPEVIFVKLIFRTFEIASTECLKHSGDQFLEEQLFYFMVLVLYLMQSGSHCKIANTSINLITSESTSKHKIILDTLNCNFQQIGIVYPTLLFQWCYILTVLNYHNSGFWDRLLNYDLTNFKSTSLHSDIIQLGVCIAYSEYLTENVHKVETLKQFLNNKISLIVDLHEEIPINELIVTLHRDSSTSLLILKAIEEKLHQNYKPSYISKILKTLENSSSQQTGYLILLLMKRFINCRQLTLQRSVSTLTTRKVEYLLTLSTEDVHKQLAKEKLQEIMSLFEDKKFATRNEGLLSVLNKLSMQFYKLSPMELDQRKSVNPEDIKTLSVNKIWYLNEIRKKCQTTTNANDLAELLCVLDYNDVVEVLSEKGFNRLILKDVVMLCANRNDCNNRNNCLFNAAVDVIFRDIFEILRFLPTTNEIYMSDVGYLCLPPSNYSTELSHLFSNNEFWYKLHNLIPSVIAYIDVINNYSLTIPEQFLNSICKFVTLSLESIVFLISNDKSELNVHYINRSLQSAYTTLQNNQLVNTLSSNENCLWSCSFANAIYKFVEFLLLDREPLPSFPRNCLKQSLEDVKTAPVAIASHQLFTLVAWIENIRSNECPIPSTLYRPIKKIVVLLSRLPQVNSYVLTPPSAWKNGWNVELCGTFGTQVPPLPVDYMQQIDILEEYIFRVNLLGWRNRQQFEETWMSLLSVLSSNPEEDVPEEVNRSGHATALAISAITSILVLTTYHPNPGNRNSSRILHVSRDAVIENNSASISKLRIIQTNLFKKCKEYSDTQQMEDVPIQNVFDKPNLEKHNSSYSIGQISLEYLLISAKIVDDPSEENPIARLYKTKQKNSIECGVDLNSCLQFLLDLYSQWISDQTSAPLRVINEVIKSVLIISDLFLAKAQFQWMLDSMSEIAKAHATEDEILHQYLIVCLSKAVAVLNPDMDTYELVKRSISQGLKSSFLAMRIASLHGLLYILQGCVLSNTIIGGISDELQLFLPMITEYSQCNINTTNNVLIRSQDHCLLVWAITFYVIENVKEAHLPNEFVIRSVQTAITMLNGQKYTKVVHNAVMKGLERLIVTKSLPMRLYEQITKLALDKMKDDNPIFALPAVQLLISCMYIECEDQLEDTERSNGIVQTTPDNLVQSIEKISALFDKIKKGNPFEVDILCAILPNILNDFFLPSDILTKVVGEFLSPQQNHPKLLSKVVFQVFESGIEQKQLPLLQDWVVFSLSNFAQSFSVGMATWCLTCFFISASTNPWLRSFFPYVQSRIGRYEYEDKKILCIAGADFYRNLTTAKQKQTFVETFSKIKNQVDMPFNHLLESL